MNYLKDPRDGETTRPFSRAWVKPTSGEPSGSGSGSKPCREDKGKTGKGLKAKNRTSKDKPASDDKKRGSKRPMADKDKEGTINLHRQESFYGICAFWLKNNYYLAL